MSLQAASEASSNAFAVSRVTNTLGAASPLSCPGPQDGLSQVHQTRLAPLGTPHNNPHYGARWQIDACVIKLVRNLCKQRGVPVVKPLLVICPPCSCSSLLPAVSCSSSTVWKVTLRPCARCHQHAITNQFLCFKRLFQNCHCPHASFPCRT